MKILVLGATGMAGHTLSIYLTEAGHDVTAFSRSKFSYCNNIIGDARDLNLLGAVVEDGNYNAVINAIGILNEEAEINKSLAVLLNSHLPHFLSELTKAMKTRIIQMSTDCVFSGKTGGYAENSFRDGATFYDRSKALGELENNKDLTFRTSIIGPDNNKEGFGLFNWFMKQDRKVSGFTKAIWSGVTALTLAKAIEKAIDEELTGLYHLVNNEKISKYDLLKLFNRHFKDNAIIIEPSDKVVLDKSLVNNRNDFSFKVPGYEEMIIDMKQWIEKHQGLYPHYFS